MKSKILYGQSELNPGYRLEVIFDDPDGGELGRVSHTGKLDYARVDWAGFSRLPESERQAILDELKEVFVQEVLPRL